MTTHSVLSNPTVDGLVEQLTAIRQRLFWLAACFATSLSWDVAYESDAWRERFRALADQLREHDPAALERITQGYEALLYAEPVRRPTVPLRAQEDFELVSQLRYERRKPPQPKPPGYIPDGLQRFV